MLVSADVTTYRVEEHLASLPPSCIHAAVTQLSRTQCSSPLFSSLPIRAARPFFHLSSPIFSRTQRHSLRALASNFPLFAIIAHHRRIRHRRVFPLFKSNHIRDRCPSLFSSSRLSTGRPRIEIASELESKARHRFRISKERRDGPRGRTRHGTADEHRSVVGRDSYMRDLYPRVI